MGEGVSVDLGALSTFAHDLGGLTDATLHQVYGYAADLAGLAQLIETTNAAPPHTPQPGQAATGSVNAGAQFLEAQSFARYHGVIATSGRQFLNDVVQGTSSLAAGAEVCAINYAGADNFNAASLNKLRADMQGGGKFAAIDFVLHGQGQVSSGQVDDAFAPKGDRALWGAPPSGNPGTPATTTALPPDVQKKLDADFKQKVDEAKQNIVNNQPADPAKATGLNGSAFTIGKDDSVIEVPADDPSGAMDLTMPKQPAQ